MNRDILNLEEAYVKIYLKEEEELSPSVDNAYPQMEAPAAVNPHEKGEDNEKWKHFVSHRHPNMHPGIDYTEGRDAEGEYVIWDEVDPQEGGITKWHHKMYKHRDNPESISKDEFDKAWKSGKNYDEYWAGEKKRYEDGVSQLRGESVDGESDEEEWGEDDEENDKLPPKKKSDEEEVTEEVESDDEGWGEDDEENDKLPPKKDEEVEEAVKVPSRAKLISKKRSPIHKPTKTIKPKKGVYDRKKVKKEND